MDRDFSSAQRRRHLLLGIAKAISAVIVVAVLGWVALQMFGPSVKRTEIRTAVVERGPLEATVTATGTIVPRTEQTLSSPVRAEITVVHVALGQRVHSGQPIISLDTRASELTLRTLEEQLAVKNAEMRSQDLQRADAIRQARSRRALLQIDLESREVRLGRLRRLGESGSVSESDLLEAELDVRRTEVEIEQTDAEILSLEARRAAELERLDLDYSILDSQRADQARRVEMSTVTATINGIVTSLVHDAGAVVQENQALATIAADDAFRVEAAVSDFYGPQLRPGQPARITSSTNEFMGRVNRILPTAETSTLELFIELDDPTAPAFHTNLRVDIEIITAEKADVLKVRRGPALESAGVGQVYVVEGDRAVRRPVRLGVSERREIEIVEGLDPGEEIIISDTSSFERLTEVRIKQ